MEAYKIHANDLMESELDYELSIRNCSTHEPIVSKRRTLRRLLRASEDPELVLASRYEFESDYARIPLVLQEMENQMASGVAGGYLSRLVHYHKRVRRYVPQNNQQEEHQRILLYIINRLAKKYYGVDFLEANWLVPTCRIIPVGNQSHAASLRNDLPASSRTGTIPKQSAAVSGLLGVALAGDNNRANARGEEPSIEEGAVGGSTFPVADPPSFPFNSYQERPVSSRIQPEDRGRRRQSAPAGPEHYVETTDTVATDAQRTSSVNAKPGTNPTFGGRQQTPPSSQMDFFNQRTASRSNPGMRQDPPAQVMSNAGLDRHGISAASSPAPSPSETRNVNVNEYVHAADIEAYVQSYLTRMLRSAPQLPAVTATVVAQLTDQINNVRFQDPEVSRISREMPEDPSSRMSTPLPLRMPVRNPSSSNPFLEGEVENRDYRGEISPMSVGSRAVPGTHGTAPPGQHLYDPNVPIPGRHLSMATDYPRRLPHQQCNIIEKWPKFSGDNNAIPVSDFLRQIDILCRSYVISKPELRMHAHLLFRDSAYVWFTTYEGKCDTWESLEAYLKMRFDNPNRDRLIREELRNRKQRPNELFSAFLTDIETLAQRMIKKMSEQEKLELVVENMKISYKRRLALQPVLSIEQLAQLCFKFDALEPNLYQVGGASKTAVHQLVVEEDSDDAEEHEHSEEVYALFGQNPKSNRNVQRNEADGTKRKGQRIGGMQSQALCWNCKEIGHMWRECDQRKTIFCHVCGHTDTTAFQCPNKHDLGPRGNDGQKNE